LALPDFWCSASRLLMVQDLPNWRTVAFYASGSRRPQFIGAFSTCVLEP
jgi:hypothetical protein